MPDADIPQAVRETGVDPVEVTRRSRRPGRRPCARPSTELLDEVEGSIAVITPAVHSGELLAATWPGRRGRVQVIDPMSTKGLEYDATVVVDPGAISRGVARWRAGALRRPDPGRPPDVRHSHELSLHEAVTAVTHEQLEAQLGHLFSQKD